MNNTTINILCATDSNFVPWCGIMLTSVFENNKSEKICAYVIVDESVDNIQERTFQKMATKYNQSVQIFHIASRAFEQFPTNENWSKAIYYRLLVADLLPESVEKIIYFDCDIIVTRSLREMWDIDITDYAVAGVMDAYSKALCRHVGLTDEKSYFNSGSVLINLDYWRQHTIGSACINYLNTHADDLWCPDQDVLNAVLAQQKLLLPLKFNFQIQFLRYDIFDTFDSEIKEYVFHAPPCVIHYAYATKPWMMLYHNKLPYYKEWYKYKNISLWRHTKKVLPKTKKINWLIKRYILWPLGINYKQEFILP